MERKEIVTSLLKANGTTLIKDLVVKNVTPTQMENYLRLGLTLDTEVPGYIQQEDDTFKEGSTRVIFVSAFSVASILKENDDASFAATHLLNHPESMSVVLSRAKIDVIQQRVATNEPYTNPWSDSAEEVTFDHDVIINHITNIKLSEFAIRRLDKLADHMMGF